MIEREKKRERLITKYSGKRESIKEQLKTVSSFKERVELYKKLETLCGRVCFPLTTSLPPSRDISSRCTRHRAFHLSFISR